MTASPKGNPMNATTASASLSSKAPAAPWYRHRWPWLLMAGPGLVIVAGVITTVIAFTGADGLVADDYYKQGLGVNRQIARDAAAVALRVRGEIALEAGTVRVAVAGDVPLPDRLSLRLVHPSRASDDRTLVLQQSEPGRYSGSAPPLSATRWLAIVETPQWRVSAPLVPNTAGPTSLAPGVGP